jgi:two-component system KDP operon response regulator KdpE
MAAIVRVIGTEATNTIIQTGDFYIDVVARSATIRGRELHLSGAEFDVLVFLVSHKRRMVTSQTKLATKLEDGSIRQTDFLSALLSLRKKLLEQVPGAQYVHTEAWILYDFLPGS